jgi:hypothetical protein
MEVTKSQLLGNIIKGVGIYVLLSYFFQGWLEVFLVFAIIIVGIIATAIHIGDRISQRYYYTEEQEDDDD